MSQGQPVLLANSLCRAQEKGTMPESEGQIENSGLNTEFFLHTANSH
jgi:hypothetical protein